MEELSNCCGAKIDGLNSSGIGRCSECKEGCGVEGWVEPSGKRIPKEELEKLTEVYKLLINDKIPEGKLQKEIDKLLEKKQ